MAKILTRKKISYWRGEEEEGSTSLSLNREEFLVDELSPEQLTSSGDNLLANRFRLEPSRLSFTLSQENIVNHSANSVIHPNTRWYQVWVKIILVWAIYSSFFTPLEFGFFRGLPHKLIALDIVGQIAFLIDIFLQFFIAYRDNVTYRMVYKRSLIALRYLKSSFVIDFLACMPWDLFYQWSGRKEGVRYLLWIRLIRVRKVTAFLRSMEKEVMEISTLSI